MILTTTNSIENHPIIDYLGIVTTTNSFTISIFSNRQQTIEQKKEEAFKKLAKNALNLKANAIVGIKLQVSGMANTMLLITVTGTAVKVKV